MTGKEILAGWLKEHGYDGLCGDRDCSDGCGCAFDDFMPCEYGGQDCVPAYEYRPVENAETRCPDFRNCEERHGGCLCLDDGTHVLFEEDRRCACRCKREGA
jgi:hypothetical protein